METKPHVFNEQDLANAQQALSKLPILGPAMWLYAKDPVRRYTFIAETDFTIMPPIILDQCRLYTRSQIPFAFITWAKVSDEVHQRLLSGTPKIAPHEWQGGENIWLIDIVTHFGQSEETINEMLALFPGKRVHGFAPVPSANPPLQVMAWNVPDTAK
jgi:cytolysin-activating lysine-acyltransferase